MQNTIDRLVKKNRKWVKKGHVATYIPELAKQDPGLLGISISELGCDQWNAGDWQVPFTLQSIAKVPAFICALQDNTLEVLTRKISVAPTANGFNSIENLETRNEQKPLNPMINSGAIAAISMVSGASLEEKFQRIFHMIKKMAGNTNLKINQAVYCSEKQTGDRNRSLAYYMKSTGIIDIDVEELLDVYFRLCSIEVNCQDVAKMAGVLAGDGNFSPDGSPLFDTQTAKIAKAVMATCGMYDGSGDFAVEVGLPGKSGVGGGIMAVVPKKMGIGVLGPALDIKGNSLAGWKLLQDLSLELGLSIF